jgi:hypothetical protein
MRKTPALFLFAALLSSASALADANLSNAFKACLNSKAMDENYLYTRKVHIDGTSESIMGLDCYGDAAKNLFEAVGIYTETKISVWSGGDKIAARFFGNQTGCYRKLQDGDGKESNYYWCIVKLATDNFFNTALDLDYTAESKATAERAEAREALKAELEQLRAYKREHEAKPRQ